jgi:hypothetical protein
LDTQGYQVERIGEKNLKGLLAREPLPVFISAKRNQGNTYDYYKKEKEKPFTLEKKVEHYSRERASVKSDVF